MIEDLVMKDDIRMIIELIEDKGYDLDEETISSLTKYIETNPFNRTHQKALQPPWELNPNFSSVDSIS